MWMTPSILIDILGEVGSIESGREGRKLNLGVREYLHPPYTHGLVRRVGGRCYRVRACLLDVTNNPKQWVDERKGAKAPPRTNILECLALYYYSKPSLAVSCKASLFSTRYMPLAAQGEPEINNTLLQYVTSIFCTVSRR
jgi:hypothetical protein